MTFENIFSSSPGLPGALVPMAWGDGEGGHGWVARFPWEEVFFFSPSLFSSFFRNALIIIWFFYISSSQKGSLPVAC